MKVYHDHSDDTWGWPVVLLLLVLAIIGAVFIGGGAMWVYRRQLERAEAVRQEAQHLAGQAEKLRAAEEREKARAGEGK